MSAVRVYERRGYPSLYIEWYDDDERVQRSLASVTGHAVTDKRLAMQIAREVSRGLEATSNRRARRVVFGGGTSKTIDELVEEYHGSARAKRWSAHHRKGMERWRDFWLDRFRGLALIDITAAQVENAVAGLDVSDETRRKYLMYIVGAYNYAVRKLKWISAQHDLSNVELPKANGIGVAYSLDEIRALLDALEGIDARAGWVGHVAFQCGRRLSAIRAVSHNDVDVRDDYSVITFHKDKAGRVSQGVVTGRAHELTKAMTSSDYGMGPHECRRWIEAAEKAAGIEHVQGRRWHGIKRTFATMADDMGAASKQSGTRRETLIGIYEQDWLAPKIALAKRLADAVE